MGKNYIVEYHPDVLNEDVCRLDHSKKKIIATAIEDKLCEAPEVFGKPLRNDLRNYRSFRVADYRIIFRLAGRVIKILKIGHRSNVYSEIKKRMGLM